MAVEIGGGHRLLPEMIKDPKRMRGELCIGDDGHRATALQCQICDSPCGYGMRYLELLEIPYKGSRQGNAAKEMLRPTGALDIKTGLYAHAKRYNAKRGG